MEFKIDTKESYSVVIPLHSLAVGNFTDKLAAKLEELRQNGSNNFIVDLQHMPTITPADIQKLIELHEESYSNNRSLVFTGLSSDIMGALKIDEQDLLLNIAPKMGEAIDIVSMENIERELWAEE